MTGKALAQEGDVAAVTGGAAKGARALVFGADAIPPAARHQFSANRHLPCHDFESGALRATHKLAAGL